MSSIFVGSVSDIVGRAVPLSDLAGRVTVVVNTASMCSFAPRNMELLTTMQRHYAQVAPGKSQILLFPSTDFAHQERMIEEEILSWAGRDYGLEVYGVNMRTGMSPLEIGDGGGCPALLFGRCHVKTLGANWKCPALWEQLAATVGPPMWNWTKFVCSPQGVPLVRLSQNDVQFHILKREVDLALKMF